MPNNPRAAENLKPFTGADDPRRGTKPKGTKHIATHIQEILNDENFKAEFIDSKGKKHTFKGHPLKAIIATAIIQAAKGDKQWGDWLANNGYGTRLNINTGDPVEEVLRRFGLIDEGDNNAQQTKGSSG